MDATHPYAKDATENIRSACHVLAVPYLRLLRQSLPVTGESVHSMEQMIAMLNQTNEIVL
ncbi:MAG: precorrin-6A/cobalt-precorrin-6A reductase, partial [Oscillospiraceae bacterium]|nr:precorrin-6A/cobalt-precorrin-6A reductase [Oscillospiraceae bacterium]